MTDITKLVAMLSLLIGPVVTVEAQDISRLTKIGGVVSFEKSDAVVTFTCSDNSHLQLTLLAPDLVRVRTIFGKQIPPTDHSWAIDKNNWTVPRWTLHEDGEAVTITTSELEVVVRRSPLLLEFRDAKTHALINADAQPMSYDSQGLLKSQMFDPSAGVFVAASKRFGFDEHFYGLGEKAARLDKRRGFFINWNSDTPGYIEGKDPIYQTIPFYIGLQRGTAYGVFFDNSYRSYFDFGRSSQEQIWFGAEGGELNYYFFSGPSIKKIVERYTELTGRMPLPPLWALGNQQSRWSYYPQSVVEDVVRNYRERDLPLDVIHLDINYMKDYRVFTFDSKNFPNPKAFTEKLAREGVKVVTIVDPGVKYQPNDSNDVQTQLPLAPDGRYYVFDQGLQKNLFQRLILRNFRYTRSSLLRFPTSLRSQIRLMIGPDRSRKAQRLRR